MKCPPLLRALIVCLGVTLLADKTSAAPSTTKANRPNIVILYADDMGYGDLGIQNPQSKIPTPHLDQLAREGTRFTDAHSSSGICTPSRYALLEGRYHWRKFHRIVNAFEPSVLDSDRPTVAAMLKAKGYRTACIGKWHLGWDWDAIRKPGTDKKDNQPDSFDWNKPVPGGPLSHGFDYYFGDDVPNFPPYAWIENDRILTPPTVMVQPPGHPNEGNWEARPGPSVKDWDFWAVMPKLTEKALEWIGKQKQDEPFLLYFPFTSPHAPIVPAKEFVGKSGANGYGDYVVQTDDTVGRVLAALKKHGFEENTLVIFSADNGPESYAYARIQNHDHRSAGPLRGLKRDIWEGGHRVPFVVRWPGHVPANRVSRELVSQIDVYATLATLVGSPVPKGVAEDSYNQLDLFTGKAPSARDTLVHNTNPNGYALRHQNWVLIQAKSGGVSKVPDWFNQAGGYAPNAQPGELYNLEEDLAQKNNRYADLPDKVNELSRQLESIRAKGQVR
jgi:arylsulfatase A